MHAEFLGLGLYVVTALGEAIESFLVDLLPIGTKKLESAMFTRDLGLIAQRLDLLAQDGVRHRGEGRARSEEHTSELQSLMRISYAVFCLNKKTLISHINNIQQRRLSTYIS